MRDILGKTLTERTEEMFGEILACSGDDRWTRNVISHHLNILWDTMKGLRDTLIAYPQPPMHDPSLFEAVGFIINSREWCQKRNNVLDYVGCCVMCHQPLLDNPSVEDKVHRLSCGCLFCWDCTKSISQRYNIVVKGKLMCPKHNEYASYEAIKGVV